MSDLIRREDALEAIVDEKTHTILQAWINVKKTVPSIDAVEVVRCKECRHCLVGVATAQYSNGKQRIENLCEKHKWSVRADDFCSYGERKT